MVAGPGLIMFLLYKCSKPGAELNLILNRESRVRCLKTLFIGTSRREFRNVGVMFWTQGAHGDCKGIMGTAPLRNMWDCVLNKRIWCTVGAIASATGLVVGCRIFAQGI